MYLYADVNSKSSYSKMQAAESPRNVYHCTVFSWKEGRMEGRKKGRKENEMMVMIDRDGTNDGNNR